MLPLYPSLEWRQTLPRHNQSLSKQGWPTGTETLVSRGSHLSAVAFTGCLSKPWRKNIPVPRQDPSLRHRLGLAASLPRLSRGLVNLACFSSPKHFLGTSKIFKASKQTKTNRLGNIKAGCFHPHLIDPRVQRFL